MIFDPNENYDNFLTAGEHVVTITNHKNDVSKSNKSFIEFTLTDSSDRSHNERFYLSPTAMWRFKQLFDAIGCKERLDLSVDTLVKHHLYGKPFSIRIAMERGDDGNDYRRLKGMSKAPAGSQARPSEGAPRTRREDPPSRTGGAYREDVPPPSDDDIPF